MRSPGQIGAITGGTLAAAATVAWLAGACGASAREQVRREAQDFECRDRAVGYTATGHIGGHEIGVQMDCAQGGPRIKRWKVDRGGTRVEDARSLTPGEFDRVWREIAGSGWENLKDCTTGTLRDTDPVYAFEIRDDQNQAAFRCQSSTLPYPYNGISDPLDVAAQRGRTQLGDEEPAELKELEQKQKQKARP